MPDFTKYTNYKPETAFSGVVFGARSPVLEVEINEIQQIFNTKLKRLSKVFGNVVVADSDGGVVFNPTTQELTITNCTALAGDLTAFIPSATITLTTEQPVAYLRLEERVVTGNDPLHKYGLLNYDTKVENTAIDSRVGVETSRRKVVEISFLKGEVIPYTTDPDACQVIPLGIMKRVETSGTELDVSYTFDRAKFSGSINELLDEIKASISALVENFAVQHIDLTIPAEAWVDTQTGRFPFVADILDERIKATHYPNIALALDSMDTAFVCGFSSLVTSYDGGLRFYAQQRPTGMIIVGCHLFKEGKENGVVPSSNFPTVFKVDTYSGTAPISAIVSGVEYDADNLYSNENNAPNGALILTQTK